MATDAHVHFWQLDQKFSIGLNHRIARLERDFQPADLRPLCAELGVDRVVLVQAAPETTETISLLNLARKDPFIMAVVGWVDIAADLLGDTLDGLMREPKFTGVRLMAADNPDPDWLRSGEVLTGVSELSKRDLTVDLLVRPNQLPAAIYLLEQHTEIRANINHCARPLVVADEWQPWASYMAEIAKFPNVTCKYSGLIERGGLEWSLSQLRSYVSYLASLFGPERLIFASNWPVIELMGTYGRWWDAAHAAIDEIALGESATRAIFGGNADRFYCRRENDLSDND